MKRIRREKCDFRLASLLDKEIDLAEENEIKTELEEFDEAESIIIIIM